MKKQLLFISLLCVLSFAGARANENPPLSLSGTYLVGNSQPVYKKLTDVAAVLNDAANTVTGDIIFELDSDYDGTTGETFPLTFNQFNTTGGSWTVTIRPKAGISMRTTAGDPGGEQPLIILDGADNLRLDGRPGGSGNDIGWLIRNTYINNATNNHPSTLQLKNDALFNTLTYLQLEGSANEIVHLAGTTGTQGNDNNTISYCNIRDRSDVPGARPRTGISSEGNGLQDTAYFNSGNIITHNNIFNFFADGGSSFGVGLFLGTTNTQITYNSFFQSQAFIGTVTQASVINAVLGTAASNTLISHNFIGGSAPECGGAPFTVNARIVTFGGITFGSGPISGAGNRISDNTIRNLDISTAGASQGTTLFTGIQVYNTQVDVADNTIGSSEGHDAIRITNTSTTAINCHMLIFASSRGGSITGNTIGGITIDGTQSVTSTGNLSCFSIAISSATVNMLVANNKIGSTTVHDNIRVMRLPFTFAGINAAFPGASLQTTITYRNNVVAGVSLEYAGTTASTVRAFSIQGTATQIIEGNTISDISSASLAPAQNSSPAFIGIFSGSTGFFIIRNNTIRRLRLTGTEPMAGTSMRNSSVTGIVLNGGSADVYGNKLYEFTSANNLGSEASTLLAGMDIRVPATVYNNLISLNNGANTNNCEVRGIQVLSAAATVKTYHNSIYIGGNGGATSNTAISALIGRSSSNTSSATTYDIRNNVLVNARTGGSGAHYLFYNAAASLAENWATTTSDNNVLVTVDVNKVARWGSSDLDLGQWKTTGGDANSDLHTVSQLGPSDLFTDLTTADLSIKEEARPYVAEKGTGGTGVTLDYAGVARDATKPSAGAYEYPVDDNAAPTDVMLSASGTDENVPAGSVVATLAATDPDADNSFTYTLVSGEGSTDNAAFTIAGHELKINASPDYETQSSYSIRVRVIDQGALYVEKMFTIAVTDLNDNAPVITSHDGVAGLPLHVPENQTAVTTVTATDADAGSTIAYSIVDGEDGSYFTINSATGELVFNTAPDFERPADPDENNMYIVTVEASDGELASFQRFKVWVTNVNDNAPEFGSYDGDAAVTLRIPENTTIVGTVWAVDKEPNTTITYSIASGYDGAQFTVDPVTGVFTFITPPDFENPADQYVANVYIVIVQASDGELASFQRFKIKITDVEEDAGRMTSRSGNVPQTAAVEIQTGRRIKVYPNPVTNKRFTLRMDSVAAGRYRLDMYTAAGQLVHRQFLDYTGKSVTYPIQLPANLSRGMYVLRLSGAGTGFTEKLLME